MSVCVFAFGCHPDDIEFMMSGTLFLLKDRGADIHYMNPANGCLGTTQYDYNEIVEIRRNEGKKAADFLGAAFHDSIVDDLKVYYTEELTKKITAKVRQIKPDIMLLTALKDYMEDHMNAARIGYTAAFCRGMTNYISDPAEDPILKDVAVYHALPHGLHDMMNNRIEPDFFIDIERVIDKKREMLALHESQKKWLDESQGMNAYLDEMSEISHQVGVMSKTYTFAEGWQRHNPLGFCGKNYHPLEDLLNDYIHTND